MSKDLLSIKDYAVSVSLKLGLRSKITTTTQLDEALTKVDLIFNLDKESNRDIMPSGELGISHYRRIDLREGAKSGRSECAKC